MGIASMVIGIVALIAGLVPFLGSWALVPAVVGTALGLIDVIASRGKSRGRGYGIAGLVLNPLAIAAIIGWWILAARAVTSLDPGHLTLQPLPPGPAAPPARTGAAPPFPFGSRPLQPGPAMKPMTPVPSEPDASVQPN